MKNLITLLVNENPDCEALTAGQLCSEQFAVQCICSAVSVQRMALAEAFMHAARMRTFGRISYRLRAAQGEDAELQQRREGHCCTAPQHWAPYCHLSRALRAGRGPAEPLGLAEGLSCPAAELYYPRTSTASSKTQDPRSKNGAAEIECDGTVARAWVGLQAVLLQRNFVDCTAKWLTWQSDLNRQPRVTALFELEPRPGHQGASVWTRRAPRSRVH